MIAHETADTVISVTTNLIVINQLHLRNLYEPSHIPAIQVVEVSRALTKVRFYHGIIEPVMEGALSLLMTIDTVNTNRMVHYLPHHCVIRQDKQTTKLQIVYDGSAKTKTDNISVNDCLETGPNLIPKLFDVLITF